MDVGFVGLGQMGSGMAGNLLAKGHRVTVWNRNAAKLAAFVTRGAYPASSVSEAASVGIAFSMLANDEAVEAVVFGSQGVLSAGPGVLHISSSTISTALTERLTEAHTEAGQRFLSAPVLGRPDVAEAGRLSVLAAGSANDLESVQPLFEAIGTQTVHIGEKPVMAAAAKVAANAGIPVMIQMLTEQLRIAEAHGVSQSKMAEILLQVDYGNRLIRSYGPIIAERCFHPVGFSMILGRKDVGLALEAVDGHPLPLVESTAKRMDRLIASGSGEEDWATLGQMK